MGLLDYYRQYEDMGESEYNRLLRERRAREKALALEKVPRLDLSGTEWPEYPSAEVVQASVYTARGRINGYPDGHATGLRRALAERHNIKSDQIVIGNGATELLQTAAYLLLSQGDELITPWPSYSLYPVIALRAGARPIPVDCADGCADPDALLAAVNDRTRVLVLCNPNDPTGTYLDSDAVGAFVSRLPEHVHVLIDEAYIQFQDVEDEDEVMRLVEAFPRLLVFRTFSKAYGLSGLRAGYVVGSPAASSLLGALAPVLGVNALTQAAVAQALKLGDREIEGRRRMVIEQRRRLQEALRELPVEAPESHANFIWLKPKTIGGAELVRRLEQARVQVAPGGPLGDDDHVRVAIGNGAATERLLWALHQALDGSPTDNSRWMSSENVELVTRAYEAFNRDGAKGTLPFLAQEVVWDESRLPARRPGVFHGHDGMMKLDQQNAELWLDIRADVESIVAAGEDKVVASLRARGRGRFTGEEVELLISHLWKMRAGKAVLVRLYLDRQEALEAAKRSDQETA